MVKHKTKKIVAFMLAFLLMLIPAPISEAKDNYTGFDKVQGFSRYYVNGELVKNKVSVVDNGLYYSNKDGNITAEIMLDSGLELELTEKQDGYINAYYAKEKIHSTATVRPGSYYIYRVGDGAVNVTNEKNVPGTWINLEESQENLLKQFEGMQLESKVSISTGDSFRLEETYRGYRNPDDAKEKTNSTTLVYPNNYYIYKIANGAVNLTETKGEEGTWVNISALGEYKPTLEVDSNSSKVEGGESSVLQAGDDYELNKNVSGYMNAGNAITGQNPVSNVEPGYYYIYKVFRGSLNISKQKDEPGSWINPKDIGDSQEFDIEQEKSEEKKEDTASQSMSVGSKYLVNKTMPGYYDSDNAISETNSNSRVTPGTYYVYAIYNEQIINITSDLSEPGFWVSIKGNGSTSSSVATVEETKEAEETKEVSEEVEEASEETAATESPKKSSGDPVVIVVDPGHGEGIAHNRGGLIFNEGDQNYEFSKMVIKELNKYDNVVVKTTRPYSSADPSLESRANQAAGADLFLSLHTNAAPNSIKGASSIRGVELYSSQTSSNNSMAYEITKMVSDTVNTPNRGVRFRTYDGSTYGNPVSGAQDYYGVFRYGNTAKTKYLIEFVFHTNLDDSHAFLNNREEVARNLASIIARNYNLTK